MKKTMLLAAAMLLVCISGAWAAEYDPCPSPNHGFCYWPDDGCYSINTGKPDTPSRCASERAECVANGYLYYGVEYPANEWGEGNTCEELGGVWSEVGNNPNFNDGVPIWCKWATGCESIKTDDEKENCIKNGSVFKDVPNSGIGKGKTCQGGEWTEEGRDPNAVMLGCCNWDNKGCFAVYETVEWNKCKSTERWLTCDNDEAGTCPATGGPSSSSAAVSVSSSSITSTSSSSGVANSSSSSVGVSSSSSVVVSSSSSAAVSSSSSSLREYAYCVFVNTQECYEGPVTTCPTSALLQDDCPYNSSSSSAELTSSSSSSSGDSSGSSSSGDSVVSSSSGGSQTYAYCVYVEDRMCLPWRYSPCPGGGLDNDTCPYNSSSSSDGNSPVLSHYRVHSNTLTAMHNAVNLQSTGNVTVQVFDLKGKAVRTLKFSRGSYLVPLSGLPKGLYIVRASGASWKQTIKVAVR
jgi:hypothetical protein